MHNWKISNAAPREIGILLFDRFSNHCLANAMEPLRAANAMLGREAYRWHILTPDDGPVTSSSGLPVMPTAKLADGQGDELLVLSGYGARDLATPACGRLLRAAALRYQVLVGLDTGSWLLAAAGLLNGRQATIHHELHDAFAERFPAVEVRRVRWIRDENRVSCGGAMAAFDLALDSIGATHGAAIALEVAQLFLHAPAQSAQAPAPRHADRRIATCLRAMEAHIETPLSIVQLSELAGCRLRELEQRFHRAFGASPRTVYRRIRLSAAKRLLVAGDMPVAEVALRSGYADASAFARAFRKEFGRTPKAVQIGGVAGI